MKQILLILALLFTLRIATVSGQNPFSAAGNFNVFVEGNFTVNGSETEGSVAIGGNLIVNGLQLPKRARFQIARFKSAEEV